MSPPTEEQKKAFAQKYKSSKRGNKKGVALDTGTNIALPKTEKPEERANHAAPDSRETKKDANKEVPAHEDAKKRTENTFKAIESLLKRDHKDISLEEIEEAEKALDEGLSGEMKALSQKSRKKFAALFENIEKAFRGLEEK